MVNQDVGNHGFGIFSWFGFDLGTLLQGQMRIGKLKSAYNLLMSRLLVVLEVLDINQPIGVHGLQFFFHL